MTGPTDPARTFASGVETIGAMSRLTVAIQDVR
jgi:hypothetical protein